MFSRTLALFALTAPALAHFAMLSPSPIAETSTKSPLDPSGADFPCHGANIGSYSGSRTDLTVGQSQALVFNVGASGENTAVHGGGSCQLSVTYETDPAKLKLPSSWKVIHSFVEGCPSNAPGNLGHSVLCQQNGGSDCVNQFNFEIPAELKNGNAILAWTWFNTVGNREMYMNCAAVNIKGGQDKLSSLPDMFVANVGSVSGSCATVEGTNVDFPNPGKYVTRQKALSGNGPHPVGVPSGCGSGNGSGSIPEPGPIGPTAPVGPTAPIGPTATASVPQNTGGAFLETPTPTTAQPDVTSKPTTMVSVTAPVVKPSAPAPKPSAPVSDTPSGTPAGQCRQGHVQCPVDGFYCISETQFGLCAFGCALPQAVAPGTRCKEQSIRHARRSLRFPPQARRSA